MSSRQVRQKWRPSLGLIVAAVLLTVLALPVAVSILFRLMDNELVRQTERQLLAQSAVIASISALEIEARLADGYPLGKSQPESDEPSYRSTFARLDLTRDAMLPPRPEAHEVNDQPHPAVADMAERLSQITLLTRDKTLAGFRLIDTNGLIFAGSAERGLSLAHVPEVAAALEGQAQSVVREREREDDAPYPPLSSDSRSSDFRVFTAMPVFVDGRVAAVVYASRTPQSLTKYLYDERAGILLAALTALVAAALIGFVFLRTVNRPMHTLLQRTKALGEGDREALAPLPHYGTREMAQLSESVFETAERLFDRSDFISTFAAHVSHELKSPLSSIHGAAELMRDPSGTMSEEQQQKFLDNIIADTVRLTKTASRLREFARAENPQLGGITTLREVAGQLRSRDSALPLQYSGDLETPVAISADNLAIVLTHLIDNAERHGASRVDIVAHRNGSILTIRFRDDGTGISPEISDDIFEPFYTTARASGGTGMGLAISRTLLRAHG
ncbi:MAG: HAMP domain-containing sensor histidine kinase, partial [Pseudomonadota bacterium]